MHGIILKGNRIIVPSSMRPEMRKLLHSGHLGIEKTKTRACSSLYWPNIDNELTDAIKSCSVCHEYQLKQKKEPLIPHNVPVVPWSKVGTDLCHLKNKDYVIVVDYTTNYFDLSKPPNTRSSTVIAHTKSIFSKYGIPLEVFSDNGPEFSSHEYKLFAQEYDFKHTTSSPEFPENNGLVERTIHTVKKTLRKTFKANENPCLALLALRTASSPNNGPSPSQLFYGRQTRTVVPSLSILPNSKIKQKLKYEQLKEQRRQLPELHPGEEVRLDKDKPWKIKGTVKRKCKEPQKDPSDASESESYQELESISTQSQPTGVSDSLPNPPQADPASIRNRYTTRSGREVRWPAYLNDYDTTG